MSQKFGNNSRSRLVGSLSAVATSFTIESATADTFPIATTTDWMSKLDWFKATLQKSTGQVEIVHVGVRNSGSGLFSNVLRGQEGTTALTWDAGSTVGLRLTALDHEGLINIKTTDNVFSGVNEFTQPVDADILGNAATATLAAAATVAASIVDDGVSTAKIVDRAVTAAKLVATATARLWGRISGGSGDVEQLTGAQVQSMLPVQQVRADIPSAATVDLTTGAPSTDHINITGTIGITAFTVVAGRTIFVRFAGVLPLTNSASIVTQRGANITTAAGDTCILRATAANVVEVLAYTRAISQAIGDGQTWQNLIGSRLKNTNYTNTSGRPRQVVVGAQSGYTAGSAAMTLTVGGVVVGSRTTNESTGTSYQGLNGTLSAIVPPGEVYRVDEVTGAMTVLLWAELS